MKGPWAEDRGVGGAPPEPAGPGEPLARLEAEMGEIFEATAARPRADVLARLESHAAALRRGAPASVARVSPVLPVGRGRAERPGLGRRLAAWSLAAALLLAAGLSLSWGRLRDAGESGPGVWQMEASMAGLDALSGLDDDPLAGLDPWSEEVVGLGGDGLPGGGLLEDDADDADVAPLRGRRAAGTRENGERVPAGPAWRLR